MKILVMGYGNPGRLDDGLGPALAEKLSQASYKGVNVDSNYQLNIEDAEALKNYDVAIFADAAVEGAEPFFFETLKPGPAITFTSHSMPAESVLRLAQDMFQVQTRCYALGIRGYEFNEFGEVLSEKAKANLEAAFTFLDKKLSGEVTL